jgi:protease I
LTDASLAGKSIAILVASGFEEVEMTEPQRALLSAGAKVRLISHEQGLVNGWHGRAWGHYFPVDIPLSTALAADYDAVIVPGGFRSIDKLESVAHATRFLRGFIDAGKPVALFGQAVRLLAHVERMAGRSVVADAELAEAVTGSGGTPVEGPVAVDRNLVSIAGEQEMDRIPTEILRHFEEIMASLADAA